MHVPTTLLASPRAPKPVPRLAVRLSARATHDSPLAARLSPGREKDYEVACYLYKNCFDRKFRPGGAHVYDQLGWGDKEVLAMCKVLESEPFPECKQLWCSHNAITDVGMNRLCEMLGKGAIGSLETLALYGNPESTEPVKQRLRDARAGLEVFFSVKVSTGGRENGRA